MENEKQISESLILGGMLAITGGFLDAYTYISRGGVFANAQTGNIVLLGVNLFKWNLSAASKYFLPIFAFFAGIITAEIIKSIFKFKDGIHWRQIIVAIEIVILTCTAFMPHNLDSLVNILVSYVCALQVESFRKVKGNAFATTMCTGNLRSASENLYKFFTEKNKNNFKKFIHYITVIFLFIIGAGAGAILTEKHGIISVLAAVLPLVIVFLLMFFQHKYKGAKYEF